MCFDETMLTLFVDVRPAAGVITESEMRYFYASQLRRMQNFGHEQIPFEDVMCQLNDLMEPRVAGELKFCPC